MRIDAETPACSTSAAVAGRPRGPAKRPDPDPSPELKSMKQHFLMTACALAASIAVGGSAYAQQQEEATLGAIVVSGKRASPPRFSFDHDFRSYAYWQGIERAASAGH